MDFKEKLKENLSFHNSFTYIQTTELLRLDNIIKNIANNKNLKISEWNAVNGLVNFETKAKFATMDNYRLDITQSNIMFFEEFDIPKYHNHILMIHTMGISNTYCKIFEYQIQKLMHRIDKFHSPIHLVLISSNEIPPSLKSNMDILIMPLLSRSEIEWRIDKQELNISKEYRSQLADICLGLPSRMIDKLIVKFKNQDIKDLTVLLKDKKGFLSNQGLLEVIDSKVSRADIGGLDVLQSWLQRKKQLFDKFPQFSEQIEKPKGVLIVGMPGCGKSLTAKATANIFAMPLLKLDVGQLMGKYVGDSEKNLRQALEVASHAEPCILWIDEIEKGFSGISGDQTGITGRLFGYFLTWLQENQSRVFVVATANDITQLPSELLRKGRFDELFFVDFPNQSERKNIFKILEKKYQNFMQDNLDLDGLVASTEGYSGADIQSIFNQAIEDSIIDNKKITLFQLITITKDIKSMQASLGDKLKAYRENIKKFELKPASLTDEQIKERLQSFDKLTLDEKRQESLKNYLSDEEILRLAKETDVIIIKNLLEKDNCPESLLNQVLKQHLDRNLSKNRFNSNYYGDNSIILDGNLLNKMIKNKKADALIIIDLYQNGLIDKYNLISALSKRRDIDKFSSIIKKDIMRANKDSGVIDEILVYAWQIVRQNQNICRISNKQYRLNNKYPEMLLITRILAKSGEELKQGNTLLEYIYIG